MALIILCIASSVSAQDSIQATIVLIGDAGQLTNGRNPVVDAARKTVKMDEKATVIYLGDNLYKTGLPDNSLPTYDILKAPLDSQISIRENSNTDVYFIPGNHDWANGGSNGYESILRMQDYFDAFGGKHVKMLPRDGCPGPEEVKINEDVTLVIMDSQWWLQETDKPGVESDCPYKTKDEVLTELDEILSDNSGKLVLFATHHPFRSYGPHGGYFTLKQHIFPLTDLSSNLWIPMPVIGSAYPLTRAVFGTSQDLKHPLYQAMIHAVEPIIRNYPNVIFISGHEHTLQLIQDSGYNFIVSGSGSKSNRVSKSRNTLYASPDHGFVTLQISKNKNVRADIFTVGHDSAELKYSKHLLDFSILPKEKIDTLREVEYAFKDSVSISATDQFKKQTWFNNLIFGKNYRTVWSTPVHLKVFNINKEQGGFKIKSLGGGKQTKSLKLEDKNGKDWSLRSIEKDPEKALPRGLRASIAQDIVSDMISASEPYAPLVVTPLAKAAGIPAAAPKYFFIPDDPALGKYRSLFANKVATLEDRDPVPGNTKSTDKILKKFYEQNDDKIDQKSLLNARLLDILIGDFDRHADQWKWGTKDTGIGKLYYPVPRDRDQAFFRSDGWLVKYLSGANMPYLEGFNSKISNVKGLGFASRNFDRFFLNQLDETQWKLITDTFVSRITNDVIEKAVAQYPREIKPLLAEQVSRKLKTRRDDLQRASMRYYQFISRRVNVTGSNENEYFHITKGEGNALKLTVYKKDENSDSALIAYRRSFDPKHTKELRLYGLNGGDKFEIDEDVASKIRLRIIGGKGEDTFLLRGNVRNHLYDLSTEKNVLSATRRTHNELSSNIDVLRYETGYEYNELVFPQANIGFNTEDGLLVGLGFHSRTYGFRNEPYATDQKLSTLISPSNRNAFQVKYQGQFNKLIFKNDLVINAELVHPTLNNFFGIGNNTVYDKSNDIYYYRVRYKFIETEMLLRKRFKDILSISFGGVYYNYWNNFDNNKDRILDHNPTPGLDSATVFSPRQYAGLRAKMDIVFIDNERLPTRGITWFTNLTGLKGLTGLSRDLLRLNSDMTIYAKVSDLSRFSTILRFGAGHIFSEHYEFFQGVSLGTNNYLRGYRKNRFTGQSMAYGSATVNYRLFRSSGHVLKGDFGLVGFYDIGRVWAEGDHSRKWHSDYGGGLYFTPFNMLQVSATVGVSPESALFNFSLGTKFNLSF